MELSNRNTVIETNSNHEEWYEKICSENVFDRERCFLCIVTSSSSMSPLFYGTRENEIFYCDELLRDEVHTKYQNEFSALMQQPGIHVFQYINSKFTDKQYIPFYNVELFHNDACELVLYQQYGLYPAGEERKAELKKSLKKEKIKDTLVYACYENDTDKIISCLSKANTAALNKQLEYTGTPLGLTAKYGNAKAFFAIAEKGADISKKSLGLTPLEHAFQSNAKDIVFYIYENYREQFDKEIKKQGFVIAYKTTDIELLNLLLEQNCDINCAGRQFPPLHSFVDADNLVGIRFLADNGVDLQTKNKEGMTALERAVSYGKKQSKELLEGMAM